MVCRLFLSFSLLFSLIHCATKPSKTLPAIHLNADQKAQFDRDFPKLSPEEQWSRGHEYQYGTRDIAKHHKVAAAYFQGILAAGPEHSYFAESHLVLGWMSLYGLGMPQQKNIAAIYFEIAADLGVAEAMVELGWLLESGEGIERNRSKAMSWFQKAAVQGHAHATWLLRQLSASPAKNSQPETSEWQEPLTRMAFLKVAPGAFLRTPTYAPGSVAQTESAHDVKITKSFYLGSCEVTQSQWLRIMGTPSLYYLNEGHHLPVVGVNWYQTNTFIYRLNRLSPYQDFRLPTEAEWEWACRAGTTTSFHTGDLIKSSQANLDFRYGTPPSNVFLGSPSQVGAYPANSWGFFDMHGNVLEWCQDSFCALDSKLSEDPLGQCHSKFKVIRGGSWYFGPAVAKSSFRDFHRPQDLGKSLGFRLVKGDPHQE